MGYELRAVIAGREVLHALTRDLAPAQLAPLEQGLALLPITDEVFDAVTDHSSADGPGFEQMPRGFDQMTARWSTTGPIAYVEAEYFGGVGEQRAAVWRNGALALGPLHTAIGQPFPSLGSPISQALRLLGATADGARDEFAAVGLDQHRHIEDWLPDPH